MILLGTLATLMTGSPAFDDKTAHVRCTGGYFTLHDKGDLSEVAFLPKQSPFGYTRKMKALDGHHAPNTQPGPFLAAYQTYYSNGATPLVIGAINEGSEAVHELLKAISAAVAHPSDDFLTATSDFAYHRVYSVFVHRFRRQLGVFGHRCLCELRRRRLHFIRPTRSGAARATHLVRNVDNMAPIRQAKIPYPFIRSYASVSPGRSPVG